MDFPLPKTFSHWVKMIGEKKITTTTTTTTTTATTATTFGCSSTGPSEFQLPHHLHRETEDALHKDQVWRCDKEVLHHGEVVALHRTR